MRILKKIVQWFVKYIMKGDLHQCHWNEISKYKDIQYKLIVAPEVPMPIVNSTRCTARLKSITTKYT